MTMLRGLLIALLTSLIAFITGCGGSSPVPAPGAEPSTQAPAFSGGLPGMPGGPAEPRDAGMVAGLFRLGNEFAWRHNAPDDGTDLHLTAPAGAGDSTAWAYYSFPNTGSAPLLLSVHATWLDPDAYSSGPNEGYWIGFADYAAGRWQMAGPFTKSLARMDIGPYPDIVSPGDNINVMVLTHLGNEALIHQLQVGYDDGLGYEEHFLAAPQGTAPGQRSDIQVHGGVIQIAYSDQRGMQDYKHGIRVATKVGDEWSIENLVFTNPVLGFHLALGDGGRRALLAELDAGPTELWLFYDDGSGFDTGQVLSNTFSWSTSTGVTFVNSLDNPLGDLDLALVVYATDAAAWDEMTTYYRTYDGAVLLAETPLYLGDTKDCWTLSLSTTADKGGIVGFTHDAGAGKEHYIGVFSATGLPPHWDFPVPLIWPLPGEPAVSTEYAVRELPSGDLVVGYHTNDELLYLGRWDGLTWNHATRDIHPLMLREDAELDMGVYSDGDVGVPGDTGHYEAMLHKGQAGVAPGDWEDILLSGGGSRCMKLSLAVGADDTSHFSYFDADTMDLGYMARATDGSITTETVDTGAMAEGMSGPTVSATMVDSTLYVFSTDSSHHRLNYSMNMNGDWLCENAVIPTSAAYPMYIVGSGYLEDENLVYVAFWDAVDMNVYLASATPGTDDWETVSFLNYFFEGLPTLADNESEIGIFYYEPSMHYEDDFYCVAIGPARTPSPDREVVTMSYDYARDPWRLAYNSHAGEWGLLTTSDDRNRAFYFRRSAPDVWHGPTMILNREGFDAHVRAWGLTFRKSDGMAQALLNQRIDGDPKEYLTIFSAPSGTNDWSFVNTFASVDTTTDEMDFQIGCAANADGEIVAYISHRLIGDARWDVDIFIPDGGTWTNSKTWDDAYSEVNHGKTAFENIIEGVVTNNGPAVMLVEWDPYDDMFGRIASLIPW